MSKYCFERIELNELDEEEYLRFITKSVFNTIPWVQFIECDSKAIPVFVRITKGNQFIGYFTGLLTKKVGVRTIGSPFSGWSTCHMGVEILSSDNKVDILRELIPFLYSAYNCTLIQIIDRDIAVEDAKNLNCYVEKVGTLELDIDKNDEDLFKQMKTDCRNFIRQFERRGARIEIAEPNDEFAIQYYDQLKDVFAKQGLAPTYSVEKVKRLMHSLADTDELLCLRVVDPEDKCIATSIFPGYGTKFYFWGGASYRSGQHYRPNEYMIWTAIRYWRDKGCKIFDMVGIRDYKRKFGSHEVYYSSLLFSKNRLIIVSRNAARWVYYNVYAVIKGFIKNKSGKTESKK